MSQDASSLAGEQDTEQTEQGVLLSEAVDLALKSLVQIAKAERLVNGERRYPRHGVFSDPPPAVPMDERPARRQGPPCPSWCQVDHDGYREEGSHWRPEDDREHRRILNESPLPRRGKRWGTGGMLDLRRDDRPRTPGVPMVWVNNEWRHGSDGFGLTADEARTLAANLLAAADTLDAG